MITFNASTSDRDALIIDEPYQIMPGGRSACPQSVVDSMPTMSNPNVLLHASYVTKVFRAEPTPVVRMNIRNYVKIAHKLGTRDILIHFPEGYADHRDFVHGVSLLLSEMDDCLIHFEVAPLYQDIRKRFDMNKDNGPEVYLQLVATWLRQIPRDQFHRFRMVVDTAHLYCNGYSVDDQIKFIERFKPMIKYIHLNGCQTAQFTRDKHIPMYSPDNRIDDWDKLMRYIATIDKILIVEDSNTAGDYDEWKRFASRYGLKIVQNRSIYSI